MADPIASHPARAASATAVLGDLRRGFAGSRDRDIRTASLANLGCKVNQAEMDDLERLLRAAGVRLVAPDDRADLIVVNTCAVTGVADQKSRHAVRRARRASPDALTFVTGCSVQLDAGAYTSIDPSIRVFGTGARAQLAGELGALLSCGGATAENGAGADASRIDRTRAFVKVQDGCSFHCTYCVVPRARGAPRSVAPDRVVADVRAAVAGGHREIVLTGINVGTYAGAVAGAGATTTLAVLTRRLLDETGVERVRLSSIEPQHVTDELLDVWTGSDGRCQPHFHVPLQSGDDGILRRMGRRYGSADYADVVARIRRAIPNAAIHADVIAGFPGEDEAAWSNTVELIRGVDLAGLHVFRFSARPGTPAARMVGQVDGPTKKRRSAELLALAEDLRLGFARRQLGQSLEVLFETQLGDGRWAGHAGNYVEMAAAGSGLEGVIASVRAESIDPQGRLNGPIASVRPHPSVSRPEAIAVG